MNIIWLLIPPNLDDILKGGLIKVQGKREKLSQEPNDITVLCVVFFSEI